MPAKKSKRVKSVKSVKKRGSNSIDVRSAEDVPALNDILGKNKMVAVLIYADYCGHCHTYMDNVWNGLVSNKGRKHGMASIHYDQLEKTPLASTKVSGYPTVLLLGENNTPIKFKNKETGEEEIEYPESRNKDMMEKILNTEEPGTILESVGSEPNTNDTLELSKDSSASRKLSNMADANVVIESIEKGRPSVKPKKGASVPNYKEDMLNSQNKSDSLTFMNNSGEEPTSGKGVSGGGSIKGGALYHSLLESVMKPKKYTKKRKHSVSFLGKSLAKTQKR